MAEENDAEEPDVEAEMLRMMQEELGGDDAGGGEEAAEGGDDGIDNLVEAEMLRAMETEGGGDTTETRETRRSAGGRCISRSGRWGPRPSSRRKLGK